MLHLLQYLARGLKTRLKAASTPANAPVAQWIEGRYTGNRRILRRSFFGVAALAYRLYLPAGTAGRGSLPLLVMLHGCQQDSSSFAAGTRMNALADQHRFAVLYPQQSRQANPLGCWNWFQPETLAGKGEAALIARMIGEVCARHPVDAARVYVAGMSAGAAMARILAIRHTSLFAACAVHSGLMYGAATTPGQALSAMRSGSQVAPTSSAQQVITELGQALVLVPTLVIHGAADNVVNPLNATQLVAQFKALAEIRPGASAPLVLSESRSVLYGDRACHTEELLQGGRLVLRQHLIDGLGHAWSGGDARYLFNDAAGPDASQLIWDFVSLFHREAGAAMPLGPLKRLRSLFNPARWM